MFSHHHTPGNQGHIKQVLTLTRTLFCHLINSFWIIFLDNGDKNLMSLEQIFDPGWIILFKIHCIGSLPRWKRVIWTLCLGYVQRTLSILLQTQLSTRNFPQPAQTYHCKWITVSARGTKCFSEIIFVEIFNLLKF